MDPNVITVLLANDVVKLVFKEVLRNRRIQFKQLCEAVIKAPEIQASLSKEPELQTALSKTVGGEAEPTVQEQVSDAVQSKVEDAVQQLKSAKLIEVRPAAIKDFSTLYVTENGLNAERAIA